VPQPLRSRSMDSQPIHEWEETMDKLDLKLEALEERIAPDALGNPGNNNPPRNNTNNPGNEGTGGEVSTGSWGG
jgi:hypothetical protein